MKSLWLDKKIVSVLDKLGRKICRKFKYRYSSIKRMHRNDNEFSACVGYCDKMSKNIRIEMRTLKGRFHSIEYLVDTLIHEIAHTRDEIYGPEHSSDWNERYLELKEWIRIEYGLFQPKKRGR